MRLLSGFEILVCKPEFLVRGKKSGMTNMSRGTNAGGNRKVRGRRFRAQTEGLLTD